MLDIVLIWAEGSLVVEFNNYLIPRSVFPLRSKIGEGRENS